MTWHLWPGVVLLLQGYMVVVGSGFLSASATAMFFCASESPARRPCAHRPSLWLAPHRPRRLQDLGRRLRKSAHRALHRSVAPPLTAQPAHTLQRKTAQIPSPAKPSPRTISSTSRPVRAAFPAVLPQADTLVQEPSTIPPRPANQTSIPALLTALQSEYDSIMLESLEIKKAFQSSRCVYTLDGPWNHLTLLAQARTRKRVVQGGRCHTSHR